ncbi:amino acid ABC transporter permease [Nocardioides sp.]|uniref:amino acid ABC transporter permease n=1 Tax=Nocardioides sp. TaxID=35761 RepID=UPI0026029D1A|nr:amino acid ABC transporter permease [Nocardioides sp.]
MSVTSEPALDPSPTLAATASPAPTTSITTTAAPAVLSERAVPRRHWVRWTISAVVALLLVSLVTGIARNPNYQWELFWGYFTRPVVLQGLRLTLLVTLYAGVLGFVLGVVLALARLSGSGLVNAAAWFYIWFFRSLPLTVLLIIVFNASQFFPTLALKLPLLPALFSTQTPLLLPALVAGVVALAMNEAAYAAELIRGGILSVDAGQIEAATALGLSPRRRLLRIVLPQALRSIVPGYVNQLIGLVKMSSLVYYVGLADMFTAVYILESRTPNDIVPILLAGSAWYLVIATVLSVAQYYIERYYARGAVRTLPPTPWQRLRRSLSGARVRLAEVTR